MGALSVFFLMGILSTLFLIFVSLFIGIGSKSKKLLLTKNGLENKSVCQGMEKEAWSWIRKN